MEAIILAGGFGTRLRSVVAELPKPMAPVAGRPFLEHVLDHLGASGFSRVILSVGYLCEKIIDHFGSDYRGLQVSYSVEDEPLGTGGAVRAAMDKCTEDHVWVLNGDTYLALEVLAVESHWQLSKLPLIVGREIDDAYRYGRVLSDGGKVQGFQAKGIPGPGVINAGCYVFPPDLLREYALGQKFSLEADYLQDAVKQRAFELFLSKGYFIDIGIPEDYNKAQHDLRSSK